MMFVKHCAKKHVYDYCGDDNGRRRLVYGGHSRLSLCSCQYLLLVTCESYENVNSSSWDALLHILLKGIHFDYFGYSSDLCRLISGNKMKKWTFLISVDDGDIVKARRRLDPSLLSVDIDGINQEMLMLYGGLVCKPECCMVAILEAFSPVFFKQDFSVIGNRDFRNIILKAIRDYMQVVANEVNSRSFYSGI